MFFGKLKGQLGILDPPIFVILSAPVFLLQSQISFQRQTGLPFGTSKAGVLSYCIKLGKYII